MSQERNFKENERKRLEQKKFLIQMKKEMNDLENKIKFSRFLNLKIATVRNLKISLRAMQLVAPYVLTAGLIAGGFKLVGGCPFYRDVRQQNLNIMKEFDNLGNIRYEEQYSEYSGASNILYFYGKWEKSNDGFYTRTVEKYKLKELTEEEIIELFGKEKMTLQDILGSPLSSFRESNNNVADEDIEKDNYFQAIIYQENKEDYILVRESVSDNILITILYICITALAELLPLYFRTELSSFDFGNCVSSIKERYQPVDIPTLTKKLRIKRENYDRLTR
ncbi:MAG: hypothetical protein HFH08_01440 [Bacilli bacterium]|nr:hypothetical protein [Bacilli bacterium]